MIFIGIITGLLFLFNLPQPIHANNSWYFPIDKHNKRQTLKGFEQLIDDNFYIGKEHLFPFNRFYGYHAAVDFEVFQDEIDKNVPVYFISSGTIVYIGNLPGYGGVVLQRLDGEEATALYGHLKIIDLNFEVGDQITVEDKPIRLSYLGDNFSQETSKERKHLHFGIYKGTGFYFKGHEDSLDSLRAKWFDPILFLETRNTVKPDILTEIPITIEKQRGIIFALTAWLKNLFKR